MALALLGGACIAEWALLLTIAVDSCSQQKELNRLLNLPCSLTGAGVSLVQLKPTLVAVSEMLENKTFELEN